MNQSLLELNQIWAGYEGRPVVKQVNLKVVENDFIGIIGPNGGGKSTILKTILGIIKPIKGEVIAQEGLRMGYLPQIHTIDKQFPIQVLDVVLSGWIGTARQRLWPGKAEKKKAMEWLEFAGMEKFAQRPIGELSGGQMQRVFLCRAVVGDPQLLILDEPGTYVDKNFESDLYRLLPTLNKNMAVLLVSHDVGTISSVVKTIACVNGELHYHPSNKISAAQLQVYNCPIELVSHGNTPHRVLPHHNLPS